MNFSFLKAGLRWLLGRKGFLTGSPDTNVVNETVCSVYVCECRKPIQWLLLVLVCQHILVASWLIYFIPFLYTFVMTNINKNSFQPTSSQTLKSKYYLEFYSFTGIIIFIGKITDTQNICLEKRKASLE